MSTLGVKSWSEMNFGNGQQKESAKTEFLRLEQGSNVVKIVTDPYEFLIHRYKSPLSTQSYGDKLMSCFPAGTRSFELGVDPFFDKKVSEAKDDKEKKAARPQSRWYIGVIEKKTMTFKLMEASYSLVKAIVQIAKDEDYGDPKRYYLDIKVDRNGGATGYYTVVPKPPMPLSLEEQSIIESIDIESIEKRCAPITAEQQKERIAKIDEKHAKLHAGNQNSGQPEVTKAPQPIVATEDESEDDDFGFQPVG
jgi:hypothetical protein